jgi:hypothetical protein
MWRRIKEGVACFFGFHPWEVTHHKDWGEIVKLRKCPRCRKHQRFLRDRLDPSGQSGWWIGLS